MHCWCKNILHDWHITSNHVCNGRDISNKCFWNPI